MNVQSFPRCYALCTNNAYRITRSEDLAREVMVILWLMCCPEGLIR